MQTRKKPALREILFPLLGLAAIVAAALWVASETSADLLAHSPFDSYAKQAMAWRKGRVALDQDYPWLELAIFNGKYYVSFPPVPVIPMWLLSFFFGESTPSGLMTFLYFLGGMSALYFLLRRYLPCGHATMWTLFAALGGSVLDLAVSGEVYSGGVWFQAQLLGLLLTALAFLLVDGRRRGGWAAGLICIALAVGCRPFNALYVPVLLWILWRKVRRVPAMLPYIIVPALIAAAYAAYNYARFGNPLEFGHSYLPELAQAGEGMFVPSRAITNIGFILRPPYVQGGALRFPITSGFAVYLTNPLLFFGLAYILLRARARMADVTDAALAATLVLHALLLLTHRTNGGWQYGTRYLCDLLPALVFAVARGGRAFRRPEAMLMGALIAFNIYGTIVFHWL